MEQFLELLSRYRSVVVGCPHVVLGDARLPLLMEAPPARGQLKLYLSADEDLGALLHWAGKRGGNQRGFPALL